MAAKQQSLPHYGIANNFRRDGAKLTQAINFQHKVGEEPVLKDGAQVLDDEGNPKMRPVMESRTRYEVTSAPSISRAKRFMRTGER